MKNKLTLFYLRQKMYRFFEVGIYPLMALLFLVLMLWQMYSIVEVHTELKESKNKLNTLVAKLEKYRENAKISEQDRLVYGTIIKKQIPASNNTFDTFRLMESFYNATGIELKVSQLTREDSPKMPNQTSVFDTGIFSASATMSLQSLNDLLGNYQYQFPRFMTLNEITVAKSKENQGELLDVKFIFETYYLAKEGGSSGISQAQFNAQDKKFFDEYIGSTNIDLYYETQSPVDTNEEYDPAGTIF